MKEKKEEMKSKKGSDITKRLKASLGGGNDFLISFLNYEGCSVEFYFFYNVLLISDRLLNRFST